MAGPWEEYKTSGVPEGDTEGPWSNYSKPAEEQGSGILRRVAGDGAVSLVKGAIGIPEAAVGIADIATGGRAGKAAESIGFRPKEAKQILDDFYSPEQKAANERVANADGFVDTLGTMLQNPSTIVHTVAESAPSILAGGVVGRGVGAIAKMPAWGLGAVGEGAVGAGQAAESIRQSTEDGLLTAKQAGSALLSGVGTGAFGALGGKVAQRLGISDLETIAAGGAAQASAKSLPRRVAEGAAAEGVLQEMPQSMQEQAWQNVALERPLGEGVPEAGAAGLLAGVAMGGGAGAITSQSPAASIEVAPPVDAGPLSRAVGQLPAPSIAGALPSPEQTVFVDAAGTANTEGPVRNVDGVMQPEAQARQPWVNPGTGQTFGGAGMEQQVQPSSVPLEGEFQPAEPPAASQVPAGQRVIDGEVVRSGIADMRQEAFIVDGEGQAQQGLTSNQFAYQGRPPRDFGPGMDQQTPHGVLDLTGDILPSARTTESMPMSPQTQPVTIDGEVGWLGIPDLRPEAVIVDGQGGALVGRVANLQPAEPTAQPDGMTAQAVPGQRPLFSQVLERARAGGLDAVGLAAETGSTRAQAARAIRGADAERSAIEMTFKGVPGAHRALRGLPEPQAFEVVKVGAKEWRVQRKLEQAVRKEAAPMQPQAAQSRVGALASPAGRKSWHRKVNRDRDSLLQAVIRLGGIKSEWRQDTTGDTKGNRHLPGAGALWSDKTGTSLDDMASLLDQHGYIPAGEMDNLGGVPWLQQALRDELDGTKHFAAESKAQQEQMEREIAQRYADEQVRLADQREAEYAQIEDQYGPEIAAQARAFDEAEAAYREQVLAEFQQFEDDYEQRQQERGENSAALDGESLAEASAAARDDELRQAPGEDVGQRRAPARYGEGQAGGTGGFALEQQTERSLTEQAAQQRAAEQAEAEAQRQAEQKAQADRERNDFTLSGSDRPADVAASRGQNDMFAPRTRGDRKAAESQPITTPATGARQPAAEIDDVGEKLGGARKDQLRTVRERLDEMDDAAIANSSLAQLWPKGEIDRITNPFEAALYQVVRSHIPAKPRVSYRVKAWVAKVKAARDILTNLSALGADATVEKMRAFSPLMNTVADKVELLTALDRQQWGRIGDVRRGSGRYNKDGEMVPGSWVTVDIDGRSVSFYGHETVASALQEVKERVEQKDAPDKRMKFAIYTDLRTAEVYIAKDGDSERRRLKTFGSTKEAREFLGKQHDDLVAAWDAVKNRDNVTKADMRRSANDPRVGQDHRSGVDVTPEQFLETFGFRGVEFGNWVKQGAGSRERQGMLNEAYDALMDLASVLGVPPKALSLEGKLGIGFGSRGSGKASAHFEPDRVVINLTKTKGAGALAHEWFHALDNYFARRRAEQPGSEIPMNDRKTAYITYRPEPMLINKKHPSLAMTRAELTRYQANHPNAPLYAEGNWEPDPKHPKGVRPQVEKAFAELVSTLNASPMLQRSKVIDGKSSDGYWSRIIERGARSFETYVIARLADRGYRNDYLANVQSLEQFVRDPGRYPYLTPDEQGPVNEAFDRLFSTIEVREGESGRLGFYSRASYRQGAGSSGSKAALLRVQLQRLTGAWQNAPEIKVVQSVKDLPAAQRRTVERDGAFDVEGIFSDGKVYLVADNLRDVKHAAFVLQHEVLGHAGLQGAYGQRLTPLLMSLYKGHGELRQQADALVQKFGYTPAVAMEEVLADLAAAGTLKDQSFWPRLVTAIRNALRSIGMSMSWSEGDIQALLANARRYIEQGKRGGSGRTVFSRTGDSGRMVEVVDEKGRLLAPNGKPSSLNQKQWHQARSDNFKRWFGDWQALEAQERLDAMKPLKLRTPEAWKGLNERERLAKVEETLKSMARLSEALPHSDLGEVTMSMSGAKKASSSAADPAKQAILARLQSAFEHSIYASGSIDQKAPTITAYHKLLAPIDVDGVPLVAVFTVREDANGRMFYNTVAVDRKEEAPAVSPGDMSENAQRSAPANARAPADFVRRPLTRVNPGDVSKVTDGNGEPLVLYHGTAEEFSVFEQGRAGRSTGHATAPLGIFMTSDRDVAKAYAEKATDGMPGLANVMPLFVSIKKPYRMSLAESQALDTADAAIAYRVKLEREGYDGIQLGNTGVWVAFYNTQVKSATNNTGAFDEIDPDIRYSRAGQRDIEALRKLGLAGGEARNLLDQVRNLTLGGLQQKLQEWSVRSEEGIFDGLAGIKRAEQSVGVTDPNRQGYVSARLASGIADVMHGVLHYAAPEWRDGIVSGKAGTRGVLEILGDLGADNLTPWLAWLGGKRGQLLKAQGRENNLTDADIADLLAMGKGKEELFEKVYREYAQVNEAVLDLAQEAGLIDQDARAKWLTDYYVPFYRQDEAEGIFTAPRTNRGLSHQTAAIKALKGGTLPTSDLLANMLAGWTKRIDASMKNKALLEVVDNLKGSDLIADESPRWQQVLVSRDQIAAQIRKDRKAQALAAEMLDLPAGAKLLQVLNKLHSPESEGFEQLWTRVAPTDPDIIRVQRGGKNEYYRVKDESLLRGLRFVEGSVFNDPITKIGRAFKRLLTTGVTASPDFILRNFIRDAAHAWMINKDGFTLGKDSIKGMRDALREDQDYRDLMFAGGSFQGGYVHGTDPEASAQIIRRALEKKGFTVRQQEAYMASLVNTPAKAAAMLGKGWQKYRELGDKVENANRLSTYKAAREAGKSRRQASFEAKDLMDYSLRGNFAAAQWFTDVVPFLNARLQGLYKLGRAVKGDKTLLAKEVAMKGAYIALFSLLLAGINDDDERYQALPDWDKDMHWHIFLGDEHFRIPKPFELGLVFGTVPERMLHALTGTQDGGDLAKAVSQGVFQTLQFNPVPQFYQPIRELQANRNFFRDSPIEDMSDEGKLPAARYDERTSAIGRVLGQVTGPTLGLSPKQLDHLVQGYTGTLGGYVLGMSTLLARSLDDAATPASRAGDIPILKVLYQGDAPRSSKYQSEFFDMLTEADQLHRTLKSYREEGRVESAAALLESSRDKLRHRPALGLARRQLGNIRNQMDAVYRDQVMTGDQKRQRLDDLQRRANEVAERIVRVAGADF